MKKISVLIDGRHFTSITLEDDFFCALKHIANIEKRTINDIISEVDQRRQNSNLSSAVRVYILNFYKANFSKRTS